ncbi:MAG: hypothetical protein LBL90_13985 [Prevotellaceae bacterium]|jgi:hypothetical protein|nr:hypothetical protein [Prevotellaceae bacterium]
MKEKILMRFLGFFMCIFSINTTMNSQPINWDQYYKICCEAFILKVDENYGEAIQLYNKAFEMDGIMPFVEDLKDLKECYKKLNQMNDVANVWKMMIRSGYAMERNSYFITASPSLLSKWYEIIPKNEHAIFEQINYNSIRQEFISKNINEEKSKYLFSIIIGECFSGIMRKQFSEDKKHELISKAGFSTNAELFINLASSDMLPSRSECDIWNDSKLFLAFIHMIGTVKEEKRKIILSILREQVGKGNLHPAQYAILYNHNSKSHIMV